MPLLAGQRVVVLDVETTGWEPPRDVIVEIARVTVEDGAIAAEWSSLIQPGRPIPEDTTRIHGITDAMVAGAPAPSAVAGSFREACGGLPLVIHNAAFDLPFLNAFLRGAGAPPLYGPVIDTLGLARGLFGTGGNALAELTRRHGIPHTTAHRALADARATAELLLVLAPRWEDERGVRSLDELAAASQDAIRLTLRRGSRASAPAPIGV
jgi:DNA polymerase III epsilon subunit family exonuclease